jgi:hypothetical protein
MTDAERARRYRIRHKVTKQAEAAGLTLMRGTLTFRDEATGEGFVVDLSTGEAVAQVNPLPG